MSHSIINQTYNFKIWFNIFQSNSFNLTVLFTPLIRFLGFRSFKLADEKLCGFDFDYCGCIKWNESDWSEFEEIKRGKKWIGKLPARPRRWMSWRGVLEVERPMRVKDAAPRANEAMAASRRNESNREGTVLRCYWRTEMPKGGLLKRLRFCVIPFSLLTLLTTLHPPVSIKYKKYIYI